MATKKKATKKQKIEATKSDWRAKPRPDRKNGADKVCLVCEKSFYVPKCRLGTAKYCSLHCHNGAESRKRWANHVPRKVICPGCKEDKVHHSRGFCHSCYNKFIWRENPKRKEYEKAYYLENIKEIKKRVANYRKTLAGKLSHRKNYYSRGGKDQYNSLEVKKAIYFNFLKYGRHYCENCKTFLGDSQNWFYQVDHIRALTKGGITEFENLQILCQGCNLAKRGTTIDYRFRELNA